MIQQDMASLQRSINNLPASSNARRNALREYKRAEKKLEMLVAEISQLESSVMPTRNQIQSLNQVISSKQVQASNLEATKMDIENMKPSLQMLYKKVADATEELQSQDGVQQMNLKALDEANEKVLMCKTYNVKYPLVLELSKEIYTVGCNKYVFKNYNAEYKAQAEHEAFASICE